MDESILFAGFGGQGILLMGRTVAVAGMQAGQNVTWLPSYGPEMRGGTAHCFVVLSEDEIASPYVTHPGSAIVMNRPSFDRFHGDLSPGGTLIMDSTLVGEVETRSDIEAVRIEATRIATDLGNERVANMVALGAFAGARSFPSVEALYRALESTLPEEYEELLALNRTALETGSAEVNAREQRH